MLSKRHPVLGILLAQRFRNSGVKGLQREMRHERRNRPTISRALLSLSPAHRGVKAQAPQSQRLDS
eukprot:scaffold470_cov257-Pinguiococcus_pyrenoidosus.AAC.4